MKKILLALGLLLGLSSLSTAQESYSVSITANAVTDVTNMVIEANARTCQRLSTTAAPLTDTCSQASACTNAGAVGGAACTAVQARQANARIYIGTTLAGREEFVTNVLVIQDIVDQRRKSPKYYRERSCTAWATANTTQRNTRCAAENAIDPIIPATVAAGCDLSCQ